MRPQAMVQPKQAWLVSRFGLAVLAARLGHGLGRDVVRALELNVPGVPRRQGAGLVDDVHQDLGAVGRQALAGDGVLRQHLLAVAGGLHEGGEILHLDAAGAAHGHGLQVLRAHHRADARAAGRPVQVVDDAGIEHLVLARDADGRDVHHLVLMARLDPGVGVPDRLAPDLRGVAKLRLVVDQRQIDRRLRAALEDDHVPAGELHLGAEIAAGVRAGDRARERALGDHRIASSGGGAGAGQRAGGHDQLVVGAERVGLRVDLLDQILGRQPALSQIVLRPLHVEGLGCAGARGQVDPQYFSCPGHVSLPS